MHHFIDIISDFWILRIIILFENTEGWPEVTDRKAKEHQVQTVSSQITALDNLSKFSTVFIQHCEVAS